MSVQNDILSMISNIRSIKEKTDKNDKQSTSSAAMGATFGVIGSASNTPQTISPEQASKLAANNLINNPQFDRLGGNNNGKQE